MTIVLVHISCQHFFVVSAILLFQDTILIDTNLCLNGPFKVWTLRLVGGWLVLSNTGGMRSFSLAGLLLSVPLDIQSLLRSIFQHVYI